MTSSGWHGGIVPKGFIADLFGVRKLAQGMNDASEKFFFFGRFSRALQDLQAEGRLDKSTSRLKLMPIDGYRFPESTLRSPRMKELMDGIQFEVDGKEELALV